MRKMDPLYKRTSTSALALIVRMYAEERRCERLFTHQQTRVGVFPLGPTQDERRGLASAGWKDASPRLHLLFILPSVVLHG